MKVKIQNFQSLEDVELEVRGLTVIVGKSNIGKSAIIRAISGALHNREGDAFVTEGTSHAQVELEVPPAHAHAPARTGTHEGAQAHGSERAHEGAQAHAGAHAREGLSLVWRKGDGHNDYMINGEELISVGRGAPDHIAKAGFRDLEIGRESVSAQIADQFNPLFLLNSSGSIVAEAISDIGRLSDVQKALQMCDKDRRSNKSLLKHQKSELKDLRARKELYDTYEDDMKQVQELRHRKARIEELTNQLREVERLAREVEYHREVASTLEGIEDLRLPDAPSTEGFRSCSELEAMLGEMQRHALTCKSLQGVAAVSFPALDVTEDVRTLEALEDLLRRRERIEEEIRNLEGVSSVELPTLNVVEDDRQELLDLESILSQARACAREARDAQQEEASISAEIQEVEAEFHSLLDDAGVCPTCERSV